MICRILFVVNLAVLMVCGQDRDAGASTEVEGVYVNGVLTYTATIIVEPSTSKTTSVWWRLPPWTASSGRPRGTGNLVFELPSTSSYPCNNPEVTFSFLPIDHDDPKQEFVRLRLDDRTLANCHTTNKYCSSFDVCLGPEPLPGKYNPINPGESVTFGVKYGRQSDTDCANKQVAAMVDVDITCSAGVVPADKDEEIMAMIDGEETSWKDSVLASISNQSLYLEVIVGFALITMIMYCYCGGCLNQWKDEYKPLIDTPNNNVNACV